MLINRNRISDSQKRYQKFAVKPMNSCDEFTFTDDRTATFSSCKVDSVDAIVEDSRQQIVEVKYA